MIVTEWNETELQAADALRQRRDRIRPASAGRSSTGEPLRVQRHRHQRDPLLVVEAGELSLVAGHLQGGVDVLEDFLVRAQLV